MSDHDGPVQISSAANPRIRAAAELRDRRERMARGLTLVDGAREIGRALEAGVPIEEIFVCRGLVRSTEAEALLDRLVGLAVPITEVSEVAYAKVAYGDRLDGLIAVARPRSLALADLRLPENPLVIVTEEVEKPGNVGAIARSADGAGADALIVAAPGTDLFNPNVIRASLGTVFALPSAVTSADEAAGWLREKGLAIVAARVDGGPAPWEVDLTGPTAIVLGSERSGLTAAWTGPDVVAVRLPMLGVADSLNVAATAAVLLYEARRQRGVPRFT